MVRYALLGLLAAADRHGYELKQSFETMLGGTWPLNIGQVYTTLARLERDGLVRCRLEPQVSTPDRKVYVITPAGRASLRAWLEAQQDTHVVRDEFVMRVLLSRTLGDTDPHELIDRQRDGCLRSLADLVDLRDEAGSPPERTLVLEAAIQHAEADLRWLDICEDYVR